MKKVDKIKHWVKFAEYDLKTAQAMLKSKRFLYVGFMCHLSIEKIIKAVYIQATGEEPPRIHNLIRLARMSHLYDNLTDEQRKFLGYLNPLNIEGRYPEYRAEISKILNINECANMILKTKEMLGWIKNELSE